MPLEKIFGHGAVSYPLTDSTANSLLQDADPAIHYAIELFEFALNTFVKPRLLAQAVLEDLNFPSAVEKSIHFEPTPFLLSDQLVFPLFCLYRTEDGWDEHTIAFHKDASTWEWAWILPPLTLHQVEKLDPIRRAVAVTISTFANQSFDPRFEEGKTLRELSGIQKMRAGKVRYGAFEQIDVQEKWWRAVTGQLFVLERDYLPDDAFGFFTGGNTDIDLTTHDGDKVEAFVEVDTTLPPVLDTFAPISGTKAGGTPFLLTGTGFRLGTTPRVLIGGAYASNVYVASAFQITGITPEHEASPNFTADVQVIAADGQESNILEDAFTFVTV